MSANALTHDIKTQHGAATEAHLSGQPFGLAAAHDPDHVIGVVAESRVGPGGITVGTVEHDFVQDRIAFDCDAISQASFDDLRTVLSYCDLGYGVTYSPLGDAVYGASVYRLTTHLEAWEQQNEGGPRWKGRIVLERKGSAY